MNGCSKSVKYRKRIGQLPVKPEKKNDRLTHWLENSETNKVTAYDREGSEFEK
jgi:hypothetical protein